jgi:hypothetical protein
MDEIEVSREISRMRVKLQELDNAPLQEVLDALLDVIEAAHERITDMTGDDEE